jgi:hypothetical protein
MARRGEDPYEEAKLRALIEETGAKNNLDLAIGPAYPFNPKAKNVVVQNPNKYYLPLNSYDMGDDVDDEDNPFNELEESPNRPAELTDVPTSTTNVRKPRTVAAGYDESRSVLTVVFRDGTVWNYDNVTPGQWQNFHASISKGKPWINEFKFGVGQPADMAKIDPNVQAELYSVARTAQLQYQSKYRYRIADGKPPVRKLGKANSLEAQKSLRPKIAKLQATNPAKNKGKPPKR